MANKLNTAVIGVGHLGKNHARLYAQMDGVSLVGIADTDAARGQSIAAEYHTQFLPELVSGDIEAIHRHKIQAVNIVTPTVSHFEMAKKYIEAGVHVFVEKPMTKTVEQAEELVKLAREKNVIVQVGHIERYNPVMVAAEKYITAPRFIESDRLAMFTARSIDVGVVMDLMIHDIDLILSLVQSPVQSISAMGVKLITPFEDIANARIIFENGCTANVTASRVSFKLMRQMRFFQNDMYLSLDFMERQAKMIRKAPDFNLKAMKFMMDKQAILAGGQAAINKVVSELVEDTNISVTEYEPLKAELEDFVRCVQTGVQPKVTGEDGLKAIQVANMIVTEINRSLKK